MKIKPLSKLSLFAITLIMFYVGSTSVFSQLTVDAGEDFTSCEDAIAVFGTAENYDSVLWSTTGDGEFVTPNELISAYTPGPSDISAGQAKFYLTAFAPLLNEVKDSVLVTIVANPNFEIGDEEVTICYNDIYAFQNAQGGNYSYIQWFTTNGGGFFDNENIANPTYFPSPIIDYSQGCVTIGVILLGFDPCTASVEDVMTLCFQPDAEVDLGEETHYVCYGENYTFADATATGTSFLQWAPLNGGGYFENANSINATYVPDPEFDYPQGCIYVILFGEPISPCTTSIEEYVSICFQPSPEADAGLDATITNSEAFITNATVINQESVLWETSGDGTFDSPTDVTTQYYTGNLDRENGTVFLTINAFAPSTSCPEISDELTLTINTEQNINIPEGESGFSSFVNSQGLTFEELIAPISDKLIFAQNMTHIYWPDYGINTMGDISNPIGYKMVLSSAATLPLAGTANSSVVDLPSGWSILPVTALCNISYTELTNQLGSDLILVTEIEGTNIIWPDGNVFTLTELTPGKAYMIKMANAAQFQYPACQ